VGAPHTRHPGPQGRELKVDEGGSDDSGLGVVRRIESSLAAGGFTVTADSVAGRRTVVGRRSAFGLRRVAIRVHTFVLVAVFKADATPDHLDRYLEEADQYARTVRGRRASQAGTSAVAVAVVASGQAAGDWAVRPRSQTSAALGCPVLVDVAGRRVSMQERTVIGEPYHPHLQQLVRQHVVHPLGFTVG